MATIDGIIVGNPPTFGSESEVGLIGIGERVDLCSNCGGVGVIFLTSVTSSPSDYRPMSGKTISAIPAKFGWVSGETKTVPCLVCSGDKTQLAKVLLERANLGTASRTRSLSYYKENKGKEILSENIQRLIDKLPECGDTVTLFGPSGTGKTSAAQIYIVYACRAGVSCLYINSREYVRKIRSSWTDPETTEEDVIREVSANRVLVIDEIDRVDGKESEHIMDLVELRVQTEGVTTIMITNENLASEKDGYLYSRMKRGLRIPVL